MKTHGLYIALTAALMSGAASAETVTGELFSGSEYVAAGETQGQLDFNRFLEEFTNPQLSNVSLTFFFQDDGDMALSGSVVGQYTSTYTDKSYAYDCDGKEDYCNWQYYHERDVTHMYQDEADKGILNIAGQSVDFESGVLNSTRSYNGKQFDYSNYDGNNWNDDYHYHSNVYTETSGFGGAFSVTFNWLGDDFAEQLEGGFLDYMFESDGDYNLTQVTMSMDAVSVPAPFIGSLAMGLLFMAGRRNKRS